MIFVMSWLAMSCFVWLSEGIFCTQPQHIGKRAKDFAIGHHSMEAHEGSMSTAYHYIWKQLQPDWPCAVFRYALNWVKIRVWEQEQWDGIIMIDVDVTVLGDLSHLFKLPTDFAAVPDNGKIWNR